jgi:hypothetical protein
MLKWMAYSKGDIKVKLILCIIKHCHGMEKWSYSTTIFDLVTRWSGQHHSLAALLSGNCPWYPLDRRLCGPKSRSGHCEEERRNVS